MYKEEIEKPRIPVNLIVSKSEAKEKIQAQIDEGEALLKEPIQSLEELEKLRAREKEWSDYNAELLLRLFNSDEISKEYSAFYGGVFSMSPTFAQKVGYVHNDIKTSLTRLRSILRRLDLFPEPVEIVNTTQFQEKKNTERGRDIFIAHGGDEGLKQTVARLIEKLSLKPIILHEQPNEGKTIIEKFENYSNVGFAIVILTPDDFGGPKDADLQEYKSRARQNVILELGYFLGALGRNQVCALYVGGVEIPSDISGVLYIQYDAQGAWKFQLAREIKAAGINVDLNVII